MFLFKCPIEQLFFQRNGMRDRLICNYDSFEQEKFLPWMRFEESPSLGQKVDDFTLFDLSGTERPFSSIWKK